MSKGSWQRPHSSKKYQEGWERIFGKGQGIPILRDKKTPKLKAKKKTARRELS